MSNPTSTRIEPTDIKATPAARGKRVETVRRMTRLSRRAFRERYGLSASSLQNWEDAKSGGLTDKGARKIIALVKPDGIICSFEWLMYGVGPSPQIVSDTFYSTENTKPHQKTVAISEDVQATMIIQELLAFHQDYPETGFDFIVPDDSMEPRFIKGEYVAGCRRHGKEIEKLIGLDCIVQTSAGDVLLRTIKKIGLDGRYTLACSNPNTTVEKPILYDVELLIAAPVIWTRRKDIE
jgi:DNA-binding transcriptional regulator YiaG